MPYNYIITTENDPNVPPGRFASYWQYAAAICNMFRRPLPPAFGPLKGTTSAFINRGRWVADCPLCGSAMVVNPKEPLFWCAECRNIKLNGEPMACKFPPEDEIRIIETVLLMRPDMRNRNWQPGETIQFLARENIDHNCARRYW